MRQITLTATYAPLSATPHRKKVCELTAAPQNAGDCFILGDDGNDVRLAPGQWHPLGNVDLANIQAKGVAGDLLIITP